MSSLIIHQHPISQPCRAVNWFLAKNKISGVELKMCDLMKGETMTPEFTAINPFQSVPALRIDDKETLVEAGAIMVYLSNLNGAVDQVPVANGLEYARMVEALMFHDSMGRQVTKGMFRAIAIPKFMNPKGATLASAKAGAAKNIEELKWALSIIDARLAKNGGYSAGATFTLPDYLLAAELTQLEVIKCAWPEGFSMDGFKNIAKFLEDIKTIEGYAGFMAPLATVQAIMDAPWAE